VKKTEVKTITGRTKTFLNVMTRSQKKSKNKKHQKLQTIRLIIKREVFTSKRTGIFAESLLQIDIGIILYNTLDK